MADDRRVERRFLEGWMHDRARLVEVLVAAVVLAFGINLLAARLASSASSAWATWVGTACVAVPLAYFFGRMARSRGRIESLEGLFVVRINAEEAEEASAASEHDATPDDGNEPQMDERSDEQRVTTSGYRTEQGSGMSPDQAETLIGVAGYAYASDIADYIESLFAENPAIRRLWTEQPLRGMWSLPDGVPPASWHSVELVKQATEYWVISELSNRLSEHFESRGFGEESRLRRFTRSDIPDVLLENRFLKLFSEPMEERPAFTGWRDAENKAGVTVGGTTVMAGGFGRPLYERFELVLPNGSRVRRIAPATVRVETNRFRLTFEVVFDGFATNLPLGFEELYLDEAFSELHTYQVELRMQTELTWWGIFSPRGWEYYRWLDAFVDELARNFESDAFLNRIGWETALTTTALIRRANDRGWYIARYR